MNGDFPLSSDDEALDTDDDEEEYVPESLSDDSDYDAKNEEEAITNLNSPINSTDTIVPNKKPCLQKNKKVLWKWVDNDLPEHFPTHSELKAKGNALLAKTPLQMFKTVCGKEFLELLTFETNRYRLENRSKMNVITINEMEVFLGICFYMSVIDIPFRRWYWSPGTRQEMVSNAMTVNRWEEILSVLHMNDKALEKKPADVGFDSLQKIRPLIIHLNKKFSEIAEEEACQSVDEQMIPFKGKHSLKVYMVKKPLKWGYKVWVRAGQSGFVHQFELYGDKTVENLNEEFPDIGESGLIVIRLTKNMPKGSYLYFDNYFASPQLLAHLKNNGYYGTCTLRSNRTEKCPLKSEKEMKISGRGSFNYKLNEKHNVLVCQWFDNKLVTVASNIHSVHPTTKVKRYDRKNKTYIEVERPSLIGNYNHNMGGVDKCDMLLSLYRTHLKTKKWYKRVLFHFLDVAVINSWLLFKAVIPQCSMQLGVFKMSVARGLIQAVSRTTDDPDINLPKQEPVSVNKLKRKLPMKASSVHMDVRYDGVEHFPRQTTNTAQRCKMELCSRKSTYSCIKCQVYLCIDGKTDCFYRFHQQN